jgi:lysophospholipid acyltransferase (LPLAT)-like uncharacterized protein
MKIRWDHPGWRRHAPALARLVVQTYLWTCPCELVAAPEVVRLIAQGPPVIFTPWHCHLLGPLFTARQFRRSPLPMVLMASPSRDGEFIARVARGLGFIVLSGSRRKGGVKTLRRMADFFRQGYSCGLVADGSRGPARVAQKGPLYLARATQGAIIPLAVAASRRRTFDTWDRFELPLPFSRLAILAGEPLRVWPEDKGPALEGRRQELETSLNRLFRRSQSYYHP